MQPAREPSRAVSFWGECYSGSALSVTEREKDRTIRMPTVTAELNRTTRRYCAAGMEASPKTVRSRPKVALVAQRAKYRRSRKHREMLTSHARIDTTTR